MQSRLKTRIEALEGYNQNKATACPHRMHLWAMAQSIETHEPTNHQTAAQWLALLSTETVSAIFWGHEHASA